MGEQQQKPGLPAMAEGDSFLFVRVNPKTSEFQVLYSDIFSALALHGLAETHLENLKRSIMAPAAAIAAPGFTLPTLDSMRKRQG